VLLREFGLGPASGLAADLWFLITPIFNADGKREFALNNRAGRTARSTAWATRANGQNLNINRDFMKLDTLEGPARS
jgi:hypothetical protein